MTINSYRQMFRQEETMIRAMMPRTSAKDAAPLTSPILPAQPERRVWRGGRVTVPALTFTLGEAVARG